MVMMMMMMLMMMMMIMIMIMDHDDCKCGATSGLGEQSANLETRQTSQGRSMGLHAFVVLYTFDVAKPSSSTRESIASFAECRPLGSSSSAEVSIACHEYS